MNETRAARLASLLGSPPTEALVKNPERHIAQDFAEFEQQLEQLIAVQTVGDGLREARKRRKLSSRELAKQLDFSQTRIMNLERANAQLELQTVAKVAGRLGYHVKLELVPDDANEPVISVVMPRKVLRSKTARANQSTNV